jgi:hypothetical protein
MEPKRAHLKNKPWRLKPEVRYITYILELTSIVFRNEGTLPFLFLYLYVINAK